MIYRCHNTNSRSVKYFNNIDYMRKQTKMKIRK